MDTLHDSTKGVDPGQVNLNLWVRVSATATAPGLVRTVNDVILEGAIDPEEGVKMKEGLEVLPLQGSMV
jgi:hypothetical protein